MPLPLLHWKRDRRHPRSTPYLAGLEDAPAGIFIFDVEQRTRLHKRDWRPTTQILKEKRYSHTVPKRLARPVMRANFGASSARISWRFAAQVYMLGQPYRLVKATIAVVRNVARLVCQVLPEGAVVIVESSSDASQRVNIRCENQELWMFTADLDERGKLLLDRAEMSNRTTA
jgi:hypothetical protein